MPTKIRWGISACLLGDKVRYDGGHRWDRFITETLGQWVEFVPVCPEAECGLGIPREVMHLAAAPEGPRLVTVRSRADHTGRLLGWAQVRLAELERDGLWGFIFKSGSPSCGVARVKIYDGRGKPSGAGAGLFAREFMRLFPLVPVEDEARLAEPARRENFLERVFTLQRWRETLALGPKAGHLVDFHTRHKLTIMSHSPDKYRLLGRLAARMKEMELAKAFEQYQAGLTEALHHKSSVKKNVNVLLHVLGYFKRNLSAAEKAELLAIIEDYRQGRIPLLVPKTLLNHYVRKFEQAYLKSQYYLNPPPLELKLRCHV